MQDPCIIRRAVRAPPTSTGRLHIPFGIPGCRTHYLSFHRTDTTSASIVRLALISRLGGCRVPHTELFRNIILPRTTWTLSTPTDWVKHLLSALKSFLFWRAPKLRCSGRSISLTGITRCWTSRSALECGLKTSEKLPMHCRITVSCAKISDRYRRLHIESAERTRHECDFD